MRVGAPSHSRVSPTEATVGALAWLAWPAPGSARDGNRKHRLSETVDRTQQEGEIFGVRLLHCKKLVWMIHRSRQENGQKKQSDAPIDRGGWVWLAGGSKAGPAGAAFGTVGAGALVAAAFVSGEGKNKVVQTLVSS